MRNGLDSCVHIQRFKPQGHGFWFSSSFPKNRAMLPVTISELTEEPAGQVEKRFKLATIHTLSKNFLKDGRKLYLNKVVIAKAKMGLGRDDSLGKMPTMHLGLEFRFPEPVQKKVDMILCLYTLSQEYQG